MQVSKAKRPCTSKGNGRVKNVHGTNKTSNKKRDIGQVTEMSSQVRATGHQQQKWNTSTFATRLRCHQHVHHREPNKFPPCPPNSMLLRFPLANLRTHFRGIGPPPAGQEDYINIEIRGCGGERLQPCRAYLNNKNVI